MLIHSALVDRIMGALQKSADRGDSDAEELLSELQALKWSYRDVNIPEQTYNDLTLHELKEIRKS